MFNGGFVTKTGSTFRELDIKSGPETSTSSLDEIYGIINRGLHAYLDGVTKQDGIFSGTPAKFKYCIEPVTVAEQGKRVKRWLVRIDVFYPSKDDTHGHLVIKGGDVHYWRLPGGTVLISR